MEKYLKLQEQCTIIKSNVFFFFFFFFFGKLKIPLGKTFKSCYKITYLFWYALCMLSSLYAPETPKGRVTSTVPFSTRGNVGQIVVVRQLLPELSNSTN